MKGQFSLLMILLFQKSTILFMLYRKSSTIRYIIHNFLSFSLIIICLMQLLFFCLPNEMNSKDLHLQHPNVCIIFYFYLQPLLNPLRIKLWITHHLIKVRVFVSSYCLDLVVVNFLVYTPTYRNSCSFLFFSFSFPFPCVDPLKGSCMNVFPAPNTN